MTSLAFILDWVPEPVCQTTSGKWSFSLPAMTSSHAADQWQPSFSSVIFSGLQGVVGAGRRLLQNAECVCDLRAASFQCRTPISKFSWLRSVCAAPEAVGGNLHLAHRIVFNAVFHSVTFLYICQYIMETGCHGKRGSLCL